MADKNRFRTRAEAVFEQVKVFFGRYFYDYNKS